MVRKVCISLSECQIAYIQNQIGVSFSEKIRVIIERDRAAAHVTGSNKSSKFGIDIDKYPQLSLFDEE